MKPADQDLVFSNLVDSIIRIALRWQDKNWGGGGEGKYT